MLYCGFVLSCGFVYPAQTSPDYGPLLTPYCSPTPELSKTYYYLRLGHQWCLGRRYSGSFPAQLVTANSALRGASPSPAYLLASCALFDIQLGEWALSWKI